MRSSLWCSLSADGGRLLTLRSPTEPFCAVVRKVTPPLFGVDISPVRLAVCMRPAMTRNQSQRLASL
jgi:uncharacterized protein YggT (Ycf19 family)